jgi:nucleoside-diphosphate-sugar epimerase
MDRTNRNKVLVTGGSGFLGSHLCDRLIQNGYPEQERWVIPPVPI